VDEDANEDEGVHAMEIVVAEVEAGVGEAMTSENGQASHLARCHYHHKLCQVLVYP
jgi:hypothetical protein